MNIISVLTLYLLILKMSHLMLLNFIINIFEINIKGERYIFYHFQPFEIIGSPVFGRSVNKISAIGCQSISRPGIVRAVKFLSTAARRRVDARVNFLFLSRRFADGALFFYRCRSLSLSFSLAYITRAGTGAKRERSRGKDDGRN